MEVDKEFIGRIVIGCFGNDVPKTVENFVELCKSKKYVGSKCFNSQQNYMIQMGDYVNNNGSGHSSHYGDVFDDENWSIKPDMNGVACANYGPNTNNSQFCIMLCPCDFCYKRQVFWGICQSMPVVRQIEAIKTDKKHRPVQNVVIRDCGVLEE